MASEMVARQKRAQSLNGILIISVTQDQGYGAESVLLQLLGGWPASAEPLVVAAPVTSSIYNSVRKSNVSYLALNTTQNTLGANLLAANKLSPATQACRIIHGWSSRTFEIAWWLGRRTGKPASGTLHDHPRARFISRGRQLIMRWTANQLNNLVCVSEAVRRACTDGGYRTHLAVVHNGLLDSNQHQAHVTTAGPTRIGFLGMNAPRKGFQLVNMWIAQTCHQPIEWHLYGEVHESFQAEAQRLANANPGRVFLHGRESAAAIYPQIDVLAHASTEFDPFPTVLLEAARAGLPAVATDLGGASEIVVHHATGFLFCATQPETGLNWINLLAQSPKLRTELGQAARIRFVEEFQAANMVQRYIRTWEDTVYRNDCRA